LLGVSSTEAATATRRCWWRRVPRRCGCGEGRKKPARSCTRHSRVTWGNQYFLPRGGHPAGAILLSALTRPTTEDDGPDEEMTPLTAPTPGVVDVTRLAPLPRVGAMRRELAVKDTRDALIPPHERHAVTVGECLEALDLPLLTGEHARSRVAQTVAGADLAGIVPRPMEAAPGPDTRVGRARAALWTMGLEGVYGAVIRQAIRRYALELRRRHPDTTSLTVDGADARGAAAEGPGGPCGSRREHRPDLTPRLVGRTGTAEGVPVGGHVTAGHGSARPAPRCHRPQRRQPLPDVGEPLLGAASQVFAGEAVALAAEPRCRFGTGGPQTVGRRPEVGESPAWGAWPWRWARAGRRTG